jgi:hypothetical protein
MPEFNETADQRRNRIADLLVGMDIAEHEPYTPTFASMPPEIFPHSPAANPDMTAGAVTAPGGSQIALSTLSDPDSVNSDQTFGPIGGPATPGASDKYAPGDEAGDKSDFEGAGKDQADPGQGSFAPGFTAPSAPG